MARPVQLRAIIGRVVAGVIAARHARELEKEAAQPVAAGRALGGEVLQSRSPLHAPNMEQTGP